MSGQKVITLRAKSDDKIGSPECFEHEISTHLQGGYRITHVSSAVSGSVNSSRHYVAISGFTKEAQYEAERSNFPITLIDSDWLVDLLVSNYDKLDPETKALVPLRKIYWPV